MPLSSLIIVIVCGLVAVGGIIVLVIRNRKPKGPATPIRPAATPRAGGQAGPARRNYGAAGTDTQPTRRNRES